MKAVWWMAIQGDLQQKFSFTLFYKSYTVDYFLYQKEIAFILNLAMWGNLVTQQGYKHKLTAILSADVVGYSYSRLMDDYERRLSGVFLDNRHITKY